MRAKQGTGAVNAPIARKATDVRFQAYQSWPGRHWEAVEGGVRCLVFPGRAETPDGELLEGYSARFDQSAPPHHSVADSFEVVGEGLNESLLRIAEQLLEVARRTARRTPERQRQIDAEQQQIQQHRGGK